MVGGVDLYDRWPLRGREGRLQHIFGIGLLLVVVVRNCDNEAGSGSGDQQVRTVGILRHQAAAVKSCDSANAIRPSGARVEREGAAEAIALHPGSLAPICLLLLVEEG